MTRMEMQLWCEARGIDFPHGRQAPHEFAASLIQIAAVAVEAVERLEAASRRED